MTTNISITSEIEDGNRTVKGDQVTFRWRDGKGNRCEDTQTIPYRVWLNPKDASRLEEKSSFDYRWKKCNPRKLNESQLQGVLDGDVREGSNSTIVRLKSTIGGERNYEPVVNKLVKESNVRTLDGDELWEVHLRSRNHGYKLRNRIGPLFCETLHHVEQVCAFEDVEKYFEADSPTHIAYIDIEGLQYKVGSSPEHCIDVMNNRDRQQLNIIGVYESWTGRYIVFAQHHRSETKTADLPRDYAGKGEVHYYDNERDMLLAFAEWMQKADPDLIACWSGGFYDIPSLYYRMTSNGLNAGMLSPYNMFDAPWNKTYNWTEQPIAGRGVIDMARALEKYWRSVTSNTLPSRKLDVVGEMMFGHGKTDFRPDFYDADYDEFLEDYVYYNLRDVELMHLIEEETGVISLHIAIQNHLKVPWGSSFNGSRYCGVMFNRDVGFRMPDIPFDEDADESYEGAYVVDPIEEGNTGLHTNIAALDAKSMYPYNIVGCNLSWETIDGNGEHYAEWEVKDRKTKQVIRVDNCRFTGAFEGALPRMVKHMLEERSRFRKLAEDAFAAGNSRDAKKFDNLQKAVKVVCNTFYGLLGFQWAWGAKSMPIENALAGATTYYGRAQIHMVRDRCKELGYPTIYGHTDSVFAVMGDEKSHEQCVKEAKALAQDITQYVQENLNHKASEWEFEQFMDNFLLIKRNSYCGRKAWDDRYQYDIVNEPFLKQLKIQGGGLPIRATNAAPISKEVLEETVKLLFDGVSKKQVIEYVREVYSDAVNGSIPLEKLLGRKRLGMHVPSDYHKKGPESPVFAPRGLTRNARRTFERRHKGNVAYGLPSERAIEQWKSGLEVWRLMPKPYCGAAWFNSHIADNSNPPFSKDDSFYWMCVVGGPTPVPARPVRLPSLNHEKPRTHTGIIGFNDLNEVEGYEPDYLALAEEHIISGIRPVFQGLQWDLEDVRRVPFMLRNDHYAVPIY